MSKHTPSRAYLQSTFTVGDPVTGSYVTLTGSTKFGDTPDDTHSFTGSLYVNGKLVAGEGTASGDIINESPFGGATNNSYFTEIISVDSSSGNLYSSSNVLPAGCQSYAVGCRVLTNFATASQFYLGISGSVGGFATKWGSYIDGTANVTNSTSSMEGGLIYHATSSLVYVSSSVRQGDLITSGAIRIEGRYRTVTAPTS